MHTSFHWTISHVHFCALILAAMIFSNEVIGVAATDN